MENLEYPAGKRLFIQSISKQNNARATSPALSLNFSNRYLPVGGRIDYYYY